MERFIDKAIVFICCLAAMMLVPFSSFLVIGLLVVLIASLSTDLSVIPPKLSLVALLIYLCLALVWPNFILFVPLIAYDLFKRQELFLKLCWLVPLIGGLATTDGQIIAVTFASSVIACVLSWRSAKVEQERVSNTQLRDELRETSLALEYKNSELLEKQDYEVKLAMLNERSRIAREIHDNVGHLLTRSVLQVEAMQVVYAKEKRTTESLAQVGVTLHEAYDTIRHSVHDLHDDAFDLHTQIYRVIDSSPTIQIKLDYQIESIVQQTGYSILAIIREALANTIKHSDATQTSISIVENPTFYRLVIHDNGSIDPFGQGQDSWQSNSKNRLDDPSVFTKASKGIGLKTMEERAKTLGGFFRFEYDNGFKVFVSVPKESSE